MNFKFGWTNPMLWQCRQDRKHWKLIIHISMLILFLFGFILVSDVDAVWALVSVGLLTITDDEVLLQILTQCLLPSLFRVVLQRIVSRVCLQHLLPDHHVLRLHHYMWVTLILWRKPTIWCLTWDRKKKHWQLVWPTHCRI